MSIEIREVTTKKEIKKFVKFPHKLYEGCEYYVPTLDRGEYNMFSDKNPSREYCDLKMWLAYRNNEIVGRVAGIINTKSNQIWNQKNVRFGWFDTINDVEVCKALIQTVEQWGLDNGLTKIHGPMCFTDFDKECLLIEGFDILPSISGLYNFAYYAGLLEKVGFLKEYDWIQYEIPASQPVPEKVERMNKLIQQRYNLKVPEFKSLKKDVMPYAHKFFDALNDSFSNLYGFVPISPAETDWYVKQYFTFLKPQFISMILDEKDDVVGFGLSLPSLSKAFQKAKGKLFPFGWFHILRALNKFEYIDLYVNGVRPEWKTNGIHSLYYSQMNKNYIKYHVETALTNPQMDSNDAIKIWEKYEGKKLVARRRVYGKEIEKR